MMIDIVGYEGKYAVDKQGNVYSLNYNRTGKTRKLKAALDKYGYPKVILYKEGKAKTKNVHRLVAQAFLPDYCETLQVDHTDRCKTNNCLSNLRMVTRQKNQWNRDGKGYCWKKRQNKWAAYIKLNGKLKHLGMFIKEEDARQAYLDAKEIYHII